MYLKLSPDEESLFLKKLSLWSIETENDQRALYFKQRTSSYDQAFIFIKQVIEEVVIPNNHHPIIKNDYCNIEFWLFTKEMQNDISAIDWKMAQEIEIIFASLEKNSLPKNNNTI